MVFKKFILILIFLCILVVGGYWIWHNRGSEYTIEDPQDTATNTASTTDNTLPITSKVDPKTLPAVTVLAENLNIPWDVAFLSDGGFLVTERVGNLVKIVGNDKKIIKLPHPVPKGEGGLLGIVLHPDFKTNKQLYLYMTTSESSSGTQNTVFKYIFENDELTQEEIIISDIPGALYHDGGRMEFGPDGYLYITTGDAQSPGIAQDKSSLGGKILRLDDEGNIPADNPFNSEVYSYGHRNPQGLTWDDQGRLWQTEHGRSGITSGLDELNLIEKGKNYGWPTIEGDKTQGGMETPALHSGSQDTWAPASAAYVHGSIFFGGLRGEALYEAVLTEQDTIELKTHFKNQYGRIRTVRVGPDGMLYITTSNRDGRGSPKTGDDKLIRINPTRIQN